MQQPQTRDELLDQLLVRMNVLEQVTAGVIAEMGPRALAAARNSLSILNGSVGPDSTAKVKELLPQATATMDRVISVYAQAAAERRSSGG